MKTRLDDFRARADGFTLIELMVVVGIIGILSAIAIPNFQKYQAKARTVEAKVQLAAIFTAELSFFTEYDTFATCLSVMGYAPIGTPADRYYSVGFRNGDSSPGPPGSNCTAATEIAAEGASHFLGNKNYPPGVSLVESDIPAEQPTTTSFLAGAIGRVRAGFDTSSDADQWNITEKKVLTHVEIGY